MHADEPLITGREAVRAAWREGLCALAHAPASASRRLLLQDRDFSDWPLDEPAVLQSLAAWLQQPGRQLWLLLCDAEATARRHPRLATWRRGWSHRITVLGPAEEAEGAWQPASAAWPAQLLGEHIWLEQLDAQAWRMRAHGDVAAGWSRFDAISQRLRPAWPLQVLGL